MKHLITATALALSLSACGLPEAQGLRNDINRATTVTHEARNSARTDGFASLAAARRTCNQAAFRMESDGNYDEAQAKYLECAELARQTMPSLLVTDYARKAKDSYQALKEEGQ